MPPCPHEPSAHPRDQPPSRFPSPPPSLSGACPPTHTPTSVYSDPSLEFFPTFICMFYNGRSQTELTSLALSILQARVSVFLVSKQQGGHQCSHHRKQPAMRPSQGMTAGHGALLSPGPVLFVGT